MLDRSTPPPVTDFQKMVIPEPQTKTLDNGIRLEILNQGDDEVNNILVMWNGGICETGNPSAQKLFDAILNEATTKHSGEEIASELEFNGSWLSVKSHLHHSTVSLHSLNSRLCKVLPVLIDIISNPSFPEDILEVKRKKLISATELDLQRVRVRAAATIKKALYGDSHPAALTDTTESINSVTRNTLVDIHRDIMLASPPTIFLSGKISPETEQLVTEAFQSLKFESATPRQLNITPMAPDYTNRMLLDYMPGKSQSAVNLAIPSVEREHPDYDMLRIAATALGGYFGSRLMANIREEKGYTYGITGGVMGTHEGAYIGISCECANEYAEPVIEEIKKEITRLSTELMSQEELTSVRRYLQSSLASTLDNPFNIIDYYVKRHIVGIPYGYFYRQQQAIADATPEKILEMASRYMDTDRMITAIAGSINMQ